MVQVEITFFISMKLSFVICCHHTLKHFSLCACATAGELAIFHEDGGLATHFLWYLFNKILFLVSYMLKYYIVGGMYEIRQYPGQWCVLTFKSWCFDQKLMHAKWLYKKQDGRFQQLNCHSIVELAVILLFLVVFHSFS